MKILIIEDNKSISDNIKKFLELENKNFTLDQAFDGEAGLKKVHLEHYDMLLLDLMLPGIDGIELCKRIRLKNSIPIIMMTAKGADDEKILGLESGADDYIVKPFKIRELQARILGMKKRLDLSNDIFIGDLKINFSLKNISHGSNKIILSATEFLILEIIYHAKTISRSDLLEKIWGNRGLFGEDNKLDVYIYGLRKKIGKNYIKTIKGFGYSLIQADENKK